MAICSASEFPVLHQSVAVNHAQGGESNLPAFTVTTAAERSRRRGFIPANRASLAGVAAHVGGGPGGGRERRAIPMPEIVPAHKRKSHQPVRLFSSGKQTAFSSGLRASRRSVDGGHRTGSVRRVSVDPLRRSVRKGIRLWGHQVLAAARARLVFVPLYRCGSGSTEANDC